MDIAKVAREAGAVVLGITAPNSLSQECTATLEVATPGHRPLYADDLTSYQLTLIDALATG